MLNCACLFVFTVQHVVVYNYSNRGARTLSELELKLDPSHRCKLGVSGNQLASLEDDAESVDWKSLEWVTVLDVRRNQLKALPAWLCQRLPKLREVYAAGNPFDDDATAKQLAQDESDSDGPNRGLLLHLNKLSRGLTQAA